jgi:4,5-dihydroxyphthalate decarboxylase
MKNLELSLMTTDYHRTHPLFSGAVSIEGAKLNVCPPPVQGDACYKAVYEQFDIAEMSLSWYVMARCRGEPLIALPVFPLRMFIQPYLFCRTSAEISGPEKLKGKTIGIQQYRITVGLWTRESSMNGTAFIMPKCNGSRPSQKARVIAFRQT